MIPRLEILEERSLLDADGTIPPEPLVPVLTGDVDLVVANAAAPATISVGQRLAAVPLTVTNRGGASSTAPSFVDYVYLSDKTVLDGGAVWVGEAPHTGILAPGGTSPAMASLTIPPTTAPGMKYLLFRADARGDQYEAGHTRQVLAVPVTVTAPDLRVTGLTAVPGAARAGDTIALRWNDLNAGRGSAPAAYADRVRVVNGRTGAVLVDTSLRYDDTRGTVASGTSRARQTSFALPQSADGVGPLQVSVTTNSARDFTEANPRGDALLNNTASLTLSSLPSAAAPALTAAVTINDGSAQRSLVKSLTVTFSDAVTLDPGAIRLTAPILYGAPLPPSVKLPTTRDIQGVDVATSLVNGKTVAVLTFHGVDAVGGALPDGLYDVVVAGAKVRGSAGQLLSGDGTLAGSNLSVGFAKLFGDTNGNGMIDDADAQQFDAARGKRRGDAGYLWYLDANGDGTVDDADAALFQQNQRMCRTPGCFYPA